MTTAYKQLSEADKTGKREVPIRVCDLALLLDNSLLPEHIRQALLQYALDTLQEHEQA